MCEVQIYIKKHIKNQNKITLIGGGGIVSQLLGGGVFKPLGDCVKISLPLIPASGNRKNECMYVGLQYTVE